MTLRYAYYGDDFTGSTDVLEQLAEGGVDAVLLLREPDEKLLARFPNVEAIGIAGDSRSRAPEWMNDHLPQAFAALQHADIVHYKTCSTFDSSPHTGSIGRAIEIGIRQFGQPAAIVVGAPHVGRYVVFGNLFARAGQRVYRIDRHPTMSRHPVTPMHEADLARHLAEQTDARIVLVPLDRIRSGEAGEVYDQVSADADAVLFDGVEEDDLEKTGDVLLSRQVRFAAGSSGVTRALTLAWRKTGRTTGVIEPRTVGAVERLLVVSGSCSPVTGQQIEKATEVGFEAHRVDVSALLEGDKNEEGRLIGAASATLNGGRSCVIYSASGPLDPRDAPVGDKLGVALGRVTRDLIQRAGLRRVMFVGGDTSSHGVAQLGADALTWAAPLEPGAPLVRAHSDDPSVDGLEMVLKGGQMGGDDFFELVRRGSK